MVMCNFFININIVGICGSVLHTCQLLYSLECVVLCCCFIHYKHCWNLWWYVTYLSIINILGIFHGVLLFHQLLALLDFVVVCYFFIHIVWICGVLLLHQTLLLDHLVRSQFLPTIEIIGLCYSVLTLAFFLWLFVPFSNIDIVVYSYSM